MTASWDGGPTAALVAERLTHCGSFYEPASALVDWDAPDRVDVGLFLSEIEQLQREWRYKVGNAARAELRKTTSPDRLRHVLVDRDVTASVAYPDDTLCLDTTIYEPAAAARRIAARFGLAPTPAAIHTGEHD